MSSLVYHSGLCFVLPPIGSALVAALWCPSRVLYHDDPLWPLLTWYPCEQQYPSGSSGVKLRLWLCWRCWFFSCRCCPFVSFRGVWAHAQLTSCSVAIVAVAVLNSCVSVALLMNISATACLSTAVAVAKFASASPCCCCISNSVALECLPLMLVFSP